VNQFMKFNLLICIIVLFSITLSAQDTRAGEEINWQVLSSGGTDCSSPNYKISGTLCQTATTVMTSGNHNVYSGFWQPEPVSSDCVGMCGNVNGDVSVNVSDVVYMINYIFTDGPAPQPIIACMDSNTDASVNIADAFYVLNYIFLGGGAPGDCSAGAGWIDGDCCEFVPST